MVVLRWPFVLLTAALGLLLFAAISTLFIGVYVNGSLAKLVSGLISGEPLALPEQKLQDLIMSTRVPRVAGAMLVGAALAIAGTAFQGLFRNPLASPDILGTSSGAALGTVLGVYLGLPFVAIEALAFVGGLVAVIAVYAITVRLSGRDPILMLVLTGMVIAALMTAASTFIRSIANPQRDLELMNVLLFGSLKRVDLNDVLFASAPIAFGTIVLLALRRRMNALSLPDEEARALGLPTQALRAAVVVAATLVTAASVAIAGIVGWIGLLMPHITRALVGPDFSRVLPVAAILGAAYLLLIDTLLRSSTAFDIPLSFLTAIIGTPIFFWLIANIQRSWS